MSNPVCAGVCTCGSAQALVWVTCTPSRVAEGPMTPAGSPLMGRCGHALRGGQRHLLQQRSHHRSQQGPLPTTVGTEPQERQ